MRYSKVWIVLAATGLMVTPLMANADPSDLSDAAMAGITAQGIDTGGGSITSSCGSNSNTVCLGTYEWNDNHQFDASSNKGAVIMDGYTQQNLSSEVNSVGAQSTTAAGVNVVGSLIPTPSGDTFYLNNYNNATSFIGGF
jgi:hypothetical protein